MGVIGQGRLDKKLKYRSLQYIKFISIKYAFVSLFNVQQSFK
jgi:hypothetical protein